MLHPPPCPHSFFSDDTDDDGCMQATPAQASAVSRIPNSQSSVSAHHAQGHHSQHQLPLPAPRESAPKQSSLTASLKAVFHRTPSRVPSYNSLHSSYSAASSRKHAQPAAQDDFRPSHPFANMVTAPLPVVSSHDASDEEEECPVCLEPLSFSFRLPGEKPHIVPECGHALHEVRSLILSVIPLCRLCPWSQSPSAAALLPRTLCVRDDVRYHALRSCQSGGETALAAAQAHTHRVDALSSAPSLRFSPVHVARRTNS